MTTLDHYDLANAIIIGNARFIAAEFTRGSIQTSSETIKHALTEINRLAKENDQAIKRLASSLLA